MMAKHFIVVSLANSYPVYLSRGKAPLFDNFKISNVDLRFSTTISFAILCNSEAEAEVWVGSLLYLHPRYAPLSIIPIYDTEVLAPGDCLHKG